MSKKDDLIKEYRRVRKNAVEQARYYRRKYGVKIDVPDKPKNITQGSINRMVKAVGEQVENLKKDLRKIRYADENSKRRARKKADLGVILRKRIMDVIQDGYIYGGWEGWKADEVAHQLSLAEPLDKKERTKFWLSMIDKIPKLDNVIEKFIFDSSQSTDTTRGKSDYCYAMIMSILFDTPVSEHYTDEDYQEDIPDDYNIDDF